MKTILKDGVYNRVDDITAESKVRKFGWKYVPKSEWNKNVRDVAKVEKAERDERAKAEKADKLSKKKK